MLPLLPRGVQTVLLLICSNVFMTFEPYKERKP